MNRHITKPYKRQAAKSVDATRLRILTLVRMTEGLPAGAPVGLTREEIENITGLSYAVVRLRLEELVLSGELVCTKATRRGKKTQPARVYRAVVNALAGQIVAPASI